MHEISFYREKIKLRLIKNAFILANMEGDRTTTTLQEY